MEQRPVHVGCPYRVLPGDQRVAEPRQFSRRDAVPGFLGDRSLERDAQHRQLPAIL